MILKYVVKVGDWPVSVAGPIHGAAFIAYVLAAVIVAKNQRWSVGLALFAMLTAVVPYATVPFDNWLVRRGRLDGLWRTEASAHPADARPLDRAFRWALRHPVPLAIAFVLAVAVIFTVLLIAGPPVG